jgi:hypothetical protein
MAVKEYIKILTVENEVKARLLETILSSKSIPFALKSYYDTALDGLYQLQMGWGYVAAPPEYAAEIREIYRDLSD